MNQAVAAWLIGFMVLGLPDSATALEIGSHGAIALLLLLASWRVLTRKASTNSPAVIQTLAGVALVALPLAFHYQIGSFLALHDMVLGSAVIVDGLIEVWSCTTSRRQRSPTSA